MGFLGVNLCFLWGVDEFTSSQVDELTSLQADELTS